jgi:DnaJ-domain-containing protein 1
VNLQLTASFVLSTVHAVHAAHTHSWIKYVFETVVEEQSAAKVSVHAVRREDAWGILGVEPGATPGEIKRAYLKLARDLHPDALIGRYVAAITF